MGKHGTVQDFLSNAPQIERRRSRLTLYVESVAAAKYAAAAKEELQRQLGVYLPEQEAVLLGFARLRIPKLRAALCVPYWPLLAIPATAELSVLKVKPGITLHGFVSKLCDDSLSVAVYGCINAVVGARDMPAGYCHDAQNEAWVQDGDYSSALLFGDAVAVEVRSVPVLDPTDKTGARYIVRALLLAPEPGAPRLATPQQHQRRAALFALAAAELPAAVQQQRLQAELDADGELPAPNSLAEVAAYAAATTARYEQLQARQRAGAHRPTAANGSHKQLEGASPASNGKRAREVPAAAAVNKAKAAAKAKRAKAEKRKPKQQ